MTDQKKPETIADEELKDVAGGITFDNGIKRKGIVWSESGEESTVKKPGPKGMERVFDDE